MQETKAAIDIMKEASTVNKSTANALEKKYTELMCNLAETENDLEYYRKALLLAGEQVSKGGRTEKLIKFCNTSAVPELKELLNPFLKK